MNTPTTHILANLASIALTINIAMRNGKETTAVRDCIVSKQLSAEKFAEAVRGHWSIENNCHWQLDVSFQEDLCRIRKDHGDENFSTLRRTALSMLKREKTAKCGIKNKRLSAGWHMKYLEAVLFNA